ncbi:universal stress protein [Rhodoplanes sp. Z2-YC6860]|uniref:universal stress protein n=1 Tax=Rhodoplanes sp. Z2-YC6860 TaxID=674703 RepID=UPI00078E7DB3|nr:universal stress protein [Rhodoplanes sp. Z2-YC6860]AMN44124.1 universal stress protein family protein [Rhodoplanes sp. Z2-YC6860]
MKILAATDFSTRSNRALRQAGLLASPVNAQLHVVHVVDDDQPEDLIRLEKKEAERILEEQSASMPELKGVDVRLMVVTGDPFAAILKTAEDVKADLVVLGSHRKQMLLDIFIGTTIERVVRKGAFPVLMVNHEAQRKYEKVIVPVDMSDPSAHAIQVALSRGLLTDKGATLVHAFTALAAGKMSLVGTDQASINSYIASERQRVTDELVAFLVSKDLGDRSRWKLRVEEGGAMEIISRAVAQLGADLLVMGTHGRSGLLKALIGSVTEEALRSLNVDILAVPPARR